MIWEYALNDGFGLKGRPDRWFLRNLEYVLRHCERVGCRVLPVILATRPTEKEIRPSGYRAKIHFLCSVYGVSLIDVSNDFRAYFLENHMPLDLYDDDSHYQANGKVVKFIASRIVEETMRGLTIPRNLPAIYAREGHAPLIDTSFSTQTRRNFTNSILSYDYYDLRDGPVEYHPMIPGGLIMACITFVGPSAGHCAVTINIPSSEGNSYTHQISMQNRFSFERMVLMRATFGDRKTYDLPSDPGTGIRFQATQESEEDGGKARGLVAMLIEAPVST